jgi:hypothetical protein
MFFERSADELNIVYLVTSKETLCSAPTKPSLVLFLNNQNLDVNNTIHNNTYKRRKLN